MAGALRANQVVIDLLREIVEEISASPAQIALPWILAQKPWIVPIPGSRKLERLDENLGSVDQKLTAGDLSRIRTAVEAMTIVGDRY